MEDSNQNRLLGSVNSDGSKAVLPGGYHSRGVPGEEGAMRNRMRVLKVDDRSQRIFNSQPLKGGAGPEHAAADHLDQALRDINVAADERRVEATSSHNTDDEKTVAYIIAKRGISALDTPVFHAGDSGEEEIVLLFTGWDAAQEYIGQAGWGESDTIGELGLSDLYQWLLEANASGIRYATVNPKRQRHLAGDPQPVLFLDALRDESAQNLWQAVSTIALQQLQ